jgi:hypothetical protein
MENQIEGELVDTKAMIQGKKKNKFFLPDPKDPSKSRENDSEYAENVKELNTLQLIDYDSEYGSIYFGKPIFHNCGRLKQLYKHTIAFPKIDSLSYLFFHIQI